jgi:hypothetical protein
MTNDNAIKRLVTAFDALPNPTNEEISNLQMSGRLVIVNVGVAFLTSEILL